MRPQNPGASDAPGLSVSANPNPVSSSAKRLQSRDLFEQAREIEIEHEGRIYKLRMTQLNKLILTAW
ncbi:hypothetical protein BH11PSE11_BH11PSE11_25600 [soil metagenome]